MLKENVMFGLRKMRQDISNTVYIVLGLGITIATIILLYTVIVTEENPNNKFVNADRIIINDNTMRYTQDSDWGSGLNFMMIQQVIEPIDFAEAKTIYSTTTHQRWVNDARYKSRILYTDHRMEKFINFDWIVGGFFTKEDYENENRVILLSEKSAMSTFGTTDVIGKYCDVYDFKFKVIGVYKNIPEHTFAMDEIVPLTTDDYKNRATENKDSGYRYASLLMVKKLEDIDPVKQLIHENGKKFKIFPEGYTLALYPHTIKDHQYTDRKAKDRDWSYNETEYANFISSLILITILAIICFVNVTNLTITSFLNRNIEIGVRISFGAKWTDIFRQSLLESILFFSISCIVGIGISQLFLTIVNELQVFVNYEFTLTSGSLLIIVCYTFAVPLISNLIATKKMLNAKPISLLKGLAA